jgi:hypothetical protein
LSRTFAAFGAQWRQQPAFTAALLGSLTADVQRFADKAAPPGAGAGGGTADNEGASSLRQLLALAACVLPMLDATVTARHPACQQHLLHLLAAFQQAASAVAGAPAAVMELAGHVGRLAALAPAAAAAAAAATSDKPSSEGPQQPAGEHVAVQLIAADVQALSVQEVQPAAANVERMLVKLHISEQSAAAPAAAVPTSEAEVVRGLQQQFAAVAAFAEGAASQAEVLAQPAAVLALLAAVRSWLQLLGQQPAGAAAGAGAVLLAAASDSGGQGSSRSSRSSWLLALRSYSSTEVVLQAAQLLLQVLQHSPAAALVALLSDTELQMAALCSSERNQSEAEVAPALLLFNLQLLQAAVPQLPAAGLFEAWQRLLPLARPGVQLAASGDQQASQLWQLLLRTLHAIAQRLALGGQQEPAGGATGAVANQSLDLLATIIAGHCTGTSSTPEPVLLLALHWLRQMAEWPAPQAPAAGSDGLAATLASALASVESPSAQLRAAALTALRAWVCGSKGCSLLLQDAPLASELFQTAVLHLADLHPAAAAAAQELVLAAAAPLALSSTLTATDASPRSNGGSPAASDAVAAALQAQRLGLRPAQLQQWLDHLTGTPGPTAVLTAAGQHQAAPLRQWLPRLLASMQAVPGSSNPGALPW